MVRQRVFWYRTHVAVRALAAASLSDIERIQGRADEAAIGPLQPVFGHDPAPPCIESCGRGGESI